MCDNPDNIVLRSPHSPSRTLWIETLYQLFTPPTESFRNHLNEEVVEQLAVHRAHCEVACDLFGTQCSPLEVFSEWEDLSYFVHLNELRRIRDYVGSMDTSGYSEEDQRAHDEAMEIMEDVIEFAENGPAEEEDEQEFWDDAYD